MMRNGYGGLKGVQRAGLFSTSSSSSSSHRSIHFPVKCLSGFSDYAVLGLSPFASKTDVKSAYKRLALKYHPDVIRGDHIAEKHKMFRDIKSAYECEAGRTPMPLCVGELHTSLDRLKRDPKAPLKGCPLLLQIWLMEHLNFVEPPLNPEKYDLRGYFGRKRTHANQTQHDWSLKLIDKQTCVRWTIPWWRMKSIVHALEAPHVRVASLTYLSFYFPCRVMRQYGRRQWIPQTDTPRPDENPIMASNVRSWEVYWQRLPRLEARLLKAGDDRVSKHYLVWMTTATMAQRAEARKAERILQQEGELFQDDAGCSSSSSKTVSIKDRLGPKKVPVWERLQRIQDRPKTKRRRKEKSRKKGGQQNDGTNPNAVEESKKKEKLD